MGVLGSQRGGEDLVVRVILTILILLFVKHLIGLRLVSGCRGVTRGGTFCHGAVCTPQNLVCSHGNGLLICGRPACSLVIIVGSIHGTSHHKGPVSALRLYKLLNVAGSSFVREVRGIGGDGGGQNCSPLAPRQFVARLSPTSCTLLVRRLHGFPNFSVRKHALHGCGCPCTTRILNSVKRINGHVLRGSSACEVNSCTNVDNFRHSCRGTLHNRGNIRVLLHSTVNEVRKSCGGNRRSGTPITNRGLASALSVSLRVITRRLLRNGVNDIITVRPSANRVLTVTSGPA